MAVTFYNRGVYLFVAAAVTGAYDVRALVIAGASLPAGTKDRDLNTVADLLGVSGVVEAAVTNYARQDLASVTVTENDATDRVTMTATAPTIANVGAGETWRAVVYYVEAATDALRELIAIDEPAATLLTNGGNVTLPQLSFIFKDQAAA